MKKIFQKSVKFRLKKKNNFYLFKSIPPKKNIIATKKKIKLKNMFFIRLFLYIITIILTYCLFFYSPSQNNNFYLFESIPPKKRKKSKKKKNKMKIIKKNKMEVKNQNFDLLPDDVIMIIFQFSTNKTLLECSACSKNFNTMIIFNYYIWNLRDIDVIIDRYSLKFYTFFKKFISYGLQISRLRIINKNSIIPLKELELYSKIKPRYISSIELFGVNIIGEVFNSESIAILKYFDILFLYNSNLFPSNINSICKKIFFKKFHVKNSIIKRKSFIFKSNYAVIEQCKKINNRTNFQPYVIDYKLVDNEKNSTIEFNLLKHPNRNHVFFDFANYGMFKDSFYYDDIKNEEDFSKIHNIKIMMPEIRWDIIDHLSQISFNNFNICWLGQNILRSLKPGDTVHGLKYLMFKPFIGWLNCVCMNDRFPDLKIIELLDCELKEKKFEVLNFLFFPDETLFNPNRNTVKEIRIISSKNKNENFFVFKTDLYKYFKFAHIIDKGVDVSGYQKNIEENVYKRDIGISEEHQQKINEVRNELKKGTNLNFGRNKSLEKIIIKKLNCLIKSRKEYALPYLIKEYENLMRYKKIEYKTDKVSNSAKDFYLNNMKEVIHVYSSLHCLDKRKNSEMKKLLQQIKFMEDNKTKLDYKNSQKMKENLPGLENKIKYLKDEITKIYHNSGLVSYFDFDKIKIENNKNYVEVSDEDKLDSLIIDNIKNKKKIKNHYRELLSYETKDKSNNEFITDFYNQKLKETKTSMIKPFIKKM
jgi:hypothetical protein